MQKSIRKYLVIVTLICSSLSKGIEPENRPWVNIFIHGIMGMDAITGITHAFQFMTDTIEHTQYANTVKIMRPNPFFQQNQAMQGIGLIPIEVHNQESGYASAAIARTYNHVASLCPMPHENYYYTFGWSGLLSYKSRYNYAQKLYIGLIDLKKEFQKQGINPKIRLIGYSHGCNLILNLGAVALEKPYSSMPLEIDEVIFLAAPVQCQTEEYINSPVFKKIYNFYSRSDHVQRKDLFSPRQLFSRRVFAKKHEWRLPSSLTQVEIRVLKKRPSRYRNTSKIYESVVCCPTSISCDTVIQGSSWCWKNVSPGHTEMWFMGWTPRNYRKDFPLHPFPIVTFIPYIIQMIESTQPESQTSRKLVADIRLNCNYMVLKYKLPKKQYTRVPFLPKHIYQELYDSAMINKPPKSYTKKEQNRQWNLAKEQAHKDIRERRRNRRNLRHR